MPSLTRILAFVAIFVICAAVALAGMIALALVLTPAIQLAARVADAVLAWMDAHGRAASVGLLAIAGVVLAMLVLEDR